MKKRSGKLSLNRETLRKLEVEGLRRANGGDPNATSTACDHATGCDCDDTVGYPPPSACFGTCSCPSASCNTWGSC